MIMIPFVETDTMQKFVSENLFAPFVLLFLTIVIMSILLCVDNVRRQFPCNYILLALFTVCMSLAFVMTTVYFDAETIMTAAGVTFVVFVGLTLFAWASCIDLTPYSSAMFVVLLTFTLFSLIYTFLPARFPLSEMIWGAIGTIIFSFYVIIDTQLIIGNKQLAISEEEYILAVLKLYVDVLNLFLYILRILSARGAK